jgi:flotillin
MIKQVMDTVKSATGVDMAGVIKAGSIEAQTDRNINVTGIPGGAPATSTQEE